MNWLGKIIQQHISQDDTVLDLGCGIMQATTNSLQKKRKLFYKNRNQILKCKSLLGCELIPKYIEIAKNYFPIIKMDLNKKEEFEKFIDNSFDIVICLDVLEHLEFEHALWIIKKMKKIARKKVIIYTPSKFITNEKNIENAWELGDNPYQKHLSFLSPTILEKLEFKISFPKPDENSLGIYTKSLPN